MNWCILEFSCYLTALFNNLSANCPSISVNFLQNKLRERITQINSKISSILNSECRLYQFHYIITDSKTGESEKGKRICWGVRPGKRSRNRRRSWRRSSRTCCRNRYSRRPDIRRSIDRGPAWTHNLSRMWTRVKKRIWPGCLRWTGRHDGNGPWCWWYRRRNVSNPRRILQIPLR